MSIELKIHFRNSLLAAAVAVTCAIAAPTSRPADRPVRDTVQVLTEQGTAALEASDKQASLDAFLDAYQLLRTDRQVGQSDPLRVTAAHGLAVAYYRAGRLEKAGEMFKPGEILDRTLATPGTAPRALVINRAVLDLRQKFNVMRAIKTTREYLAAHPDDETVLNLLGTALDDASDERYASAPLYVESTKFLEAQVARLESARPGEKRWGIEWVSEKEYKDRDDERRKFVEEYNKVADKLAEKRRDLAAREREVSAESAKRKMSRQNDYNGAVSRQNRAEREVADAEREAAAAKKQIPRYPWVTDFQPVLPTDTAVTVAIATPPVGEKPIDEPGTLKPPKRFVRPPAAGEPVEKPPVKPRPPVGNKPPVDVPADPPKPDETVVNNPPADVPADPPKPAEEPKPTRVTRYAAAFPVGPDKFITAAVAVDRADSVNLEDSQGNVFKATVLRSDEKSGLALLQVPNQRFVFLNLAATYAGGTDVKCTSFPKVSIFSPVAEQIAGKTGLIKAGDNSPWYVALAANPRLAGAPLVAGKNELVGVAMAQRDSAPAQVPAARLDALREFLGADAPSAPCPNPDPNFVLMVTAVVAK